MAIVYMAAVVTLLGSANGAPEVRVVPSGIKTQQECVEWKKEMDLITIPSSDRTGRSVLGRYVQCIPVQSDYLLEDIQAIASK